MTNRNKGVNLTNCLLLSLILVLIFPNESNYHFLQLFRETVSEKYFCGFIIHLWTIPSYRILYWDMLYVIVKVHHDWTVRSNAQFKFSNLDHTYLMVLLSKPYTVKSILIWFWYLYLYILFLYIHIETMLECYNAMLCKPRVVDALLTIIALTMLYYSCLNLKRRKGIWVENQFANFYLHKKREYVKERKHIQHSRIGIAITIAAFLYSKSIDLNLIFV